MKKPNSRKSSRKIKPIKKAKGLDLLIKEITSREGKAKVKAVPCCKKRARQFHKRQIQIGNKLRGMHVLRNKFKSRGNGPSAYSRTSLCLSSVMRQKAGKSYLIAVPGTKPFVIDLTQRELLDLIPPWNKTVSLYFKL